MKLKNILTIHIVETGIRIWAAFYIFIYGISKPTQFQGSKLIDVSIKEATEFEMMWAFFGTTKEYPIIIGSLQIVGAILLVFRKTKLFGALLLTPIFINIILLDIFYKVPFGALLNALIYQSIFIFIFIQQRKKIKEIVRVLRVENDETNTIGISVVRSLLAIVLSVILFLGFQKLSGMI